jgi:hypothetical protein
MSCRRGTTLSDNSSYILKTQLVFLTSGLKQPSAQTVFMTGQRRTLTTPRLLGNQTTPLRPGFPSRMPHSYKMAHSAPPDKMLYVSLTMFPCLKSGIQHTSSTTYTRQYYDSPMTPLRGQAVSYDLELSSWLEFGPSHAVIAASVALWMFYSSAKYSGSVFSASRKFSQLPQENANLTRLLTAASLANHMLQRLSQAPEKSLYKIMSVFGNKVDLSTSEHVLYRERYYLMRKHHHFE